jgi:membrane fusion protein (multidrug efflux system)
MAEPEKDKQETKIVPRKRRRAARYLVIVAVVVVLAAGGYYLWKYLNTYETTDDAQIDGHINAISGRIAGNVIEVRAEDEQIVNAGDVLVRLGDAEAALESSRIDIPITATNTASQLKTATSSRADATAFVLGAQRQLTATRRVSLSPNTRARGARPRWELGA